MDLTTPKYAPDYASARDHMVDSQIRPNKVVDPRIIRAMRSLPRERFLPPSLAPLAYIDEDLPLPDGRALMEPMVLARLIQLARVRPGDGVLVIGAGAGYGAAVLAACGGTVTALEEDPGLVEIARRVLPELAPGVTIREGSLADGAPGPWEVMVIEGAIPEIPSTIAVQLRPEGGRLVTVLAEQPGLGRGVLAEPVTPGAPNPKLRAQAHFDCATPLLPAFQRRPAFQF